MRKRSITIARHRTSISMEEPFWQALGEIARSREMSVAAMISEIDRKRPADSNLSSALRLYVLDWFRTRATRG
jgi:predicted DNA-binding ribbon-helix-helix protein